MATNDGVPAASRKRETVSSQNFTRRAGRAAHHSEGLAREVAAWLVYVDLKHEAGKLIQRITKETLGAIEAWTDGRHAEDDKYVELDYESAVALANATEGAAMSTVLKDTQVEPCHGFVAWHALVDGYAPKSSNDPSHSATAHTCDTWKMQGRKVIERKAHGMVIEGGRV